MRRLPKVILVALSTLAIGITVAAVWFARQLTAEVPIPTLLCGGPPTYEMPNVPCSGTDFSGLADLPVTAYCDLVRDPINRNNQIVRVRGIYSFNQENSALHDPACLGDEIWTWVEMELYSNFMHSTAGLKRNQPAEVVFLGKFSGPNKEGYGHLNGYQYQLTVMNVEELKPLATTR